jgi:hypothetical protein
LTVFEKGHIQPVVIYDLLGGTELITEEKQPAPPSRRLDGIGWKGALSIP